MTDTVPSIADAIRDAGLDLDRPAGALALRLALDLDASAGPVCSECERGGTVDPRIVARLVDVLTALDALTNVRPENSCGSPLARLRAVSDDRRNA